MTKIKVLDAEVVKRIAAGEVKLIKKPTILYHFLSVLDIAKTDKCSKRTD